MVDPATGWLGFCPFWNGMALFLLLTNF